MTRTLLRGGPVFTGTEVVDGATVVIGGLIQTQELSVNERVPLLGDIPLVGALFANEHTQDSRSNLLFFLRPRILNPEGGHMGMAGASGLAPSCTQVRTVEDTFSGSPRQSSWNNVTGHGYGSRRLFFGPVHQMGVHHAICSLGSSLLLFSGSCGCM